MIDAVDGREQPPKPGDDRHFDETLAKITWGRPLFLMMAGLLAAEVGIGKVLALTRTGLAFSLADRELARLRRLAEANAVDPDLLCLMAAHLTLRRGLTPKDLLDAIKIEGDAAGLLSGSTPAALQKLLRADLGMKAEKVGLIEPDILGEAVFLRVIGGHVDPLNVIRRGFTADPRMVAATILRAAQDFAESSQHETVGWLKRLAADVGKEALEAIVDQLPQQSVALLAFRVDATKRLIGLLTDEGAEELEALWLIAARQMSLSHYLTAAGDREGALDVDRQLADLFRPFADDEREDLRSALGAALNNLSVSETELGRREDALEAAEEAVSFRRRLASERPDAFTPVLASSLNNLANRLSGLGRREDALEGAEEAVSLYRRLASERPDALYTGSRHVAPYCCNWIPRTRKSRCRLAADF